MKSAIFKGWKNATCDKAQALSSLTTWQGKQEHVTASSGSMTVGFPEGHGLEVRRFCICHLPKLMMTNPSGVLVERMRGTRSIYVFNDQALNQPFFSDSQLRGCPFATKVLRLQVCKSRDEFGHQVLSVIFPQGFFTPTVVGTKPSNLCSTETWHQRWIQK